MVRKSKKQQRIEEFLKKLSELCNDYKIIVDANGGGGKQGEGKDRDSRFNDGAPLVLYVKGGNTWRRHGFLHYLFTDEIEDIEYHLDEI